jgi:hypothetical protein
MADFATPAVISSLIAAAAGFVTAVYAGVQASKNSRQIAGMNAELARSKDASLEYLRVYLQMQVDTRGKVLDALRDMLADAQRFRETSRILSSHPNLLTEPRWRVDLEALRDRIIESYANNQMALPEGVREAAHELKSQIVHLIDDIIAASDQNRRKLLSWVEPAVRDAQYHLREQASAVISQFVRALQKDASQQSERNLPNGQGIAALPHQLTDEVKHRA